MPHAFALVAAVAGVRAAAAGASLAAAVLTLACAGRPPAEQALARAATFVGRPLRVTLADGRVIVFDSARVVGDSLVGLAPRPGGQDRVAVPAADVRAVRTADGGPGSDRASLVTVVVGVVLGAAAWWYLARLLGGA